MPEHADKQPSDETSALTAGCLLLLVLVADVAAGLLVALALGVTAVVLLRIGNRGIGAVQLTLCVFLAVHALRSWP